MVDQLYGERSGRYAYALPCGAGKTQAVVALLTAMANLKVFDSGTTVLVVAQQVTALCEIKRKLLNAGLPDRLIGIVHCKSDADYPSTGDRKCSVMLATHARLQKDGTLPECCCNVKGKLHNLVIWDEALISAEPIFLNLESTMTAISHFAAKRCPTVFEVHQRLVLAVKQEQAVQNSAQPATEISPLVSEQEAETMRQEICAHGYLDRTGNSLKAQALKAVSLIRDTISLVDPRNGDSAALMRYLIKVPDILKNVVILDASYAIDELRQADSTIQDGTTMAMINFKDFGAVVAVHYPIASGRQTIKEDRKAFVQAVNLAKGLPPDERVLFVTFKDWHERTLLDELQSAGLPLSRKVSTGEDWLQVITWGKHTSDNSHSGCRHVVLVGLNRLPRVALASKLAAQKRDLTHRRSKSDLLDLELSVMAGDAMQAMNRGAMRLTDENGSAHSMTVHIIAKDDLRHLLERAMPRLVWETATVKPPTQTELAKIRIAEYLLSIDSDVNKVSKQSVLKACNIEMGKDAHAIALSEAVKLISIKTCLRSQQRWVTVGRSFQRTGHN